MKGCLLSRYTTIEEARWYRDKYNELFLDRLFRIALGRDSLLPYEVRWKRVKWKKKSKDFEKRIQTRLRSWKKDE